MLSYLEQLYLHGMIILWNYELKTKYKNLIANPKKDINNKVYQSAGTDILTYVQDI